MRVHENPAPGAACEKCGVGLQRIVDELGALSREYLMARHVCCENFCRNCPYGATANLMRPLG